MRQIILIVIAIISTSATAIPVDIEHSKPDYKPGDTFYHCANCPEMVVVPPGVFWMGSNNESDGQPIHAVTINHQFAVSVYEATFSEWYYCIRQGGCRGYRPDDEGQGRGNRPVIRVSWEDAQAYVQWLSQETGKPYRLLSEAEWEYAARAGNTTPFHFGNTISTNQANYDGNYTYGSGKKGQYRAQTIPVGLLPPNKFGLHDMHGNVWEWVEDCWHSSYRRAPADGKAWIARGDCDLRVIRGGSWGDRSDLLRSAGRYRYVTGKRHYYVGFRVAMTLTP